MPAELVSLGGLALAVLLFALAGDGPGSSRRGDSGARWARRRDLTVLSGRGRADRTARGGERGAGRLALGYHRGHLLRAEQRHALVAFGPPQSGKSAGLAIPALLEWHGP
jgi:type IV secretory pathway TraG/TraD family ATPase VirD4